MHWECIEGSAPHLFSLWPPYLAIHMFNGEGAAWGGWDRADFGGRALGFSPWWVSWVDIATWREGGGWPCGKMGVCWWR